MAHNLIKIVYQSEQCVHASTCYFFFWINMNNRDIETMAFFHIPISCEMLSSQDADMMNHNDMKTVFRAHILWISYPVSQRNNELVDPSNLNEGRKKEEICKISHTNEHKCCTFKISHKYIASTSNEKEKLLEHFNFILQFKAFISLFKICSKNVS